MKKNNRGYMLIEMILASVIAFTIAYFAIDMTIKIKNKNDDLLAETQAATDQAIIVNELSKIATDSRINLDLLKINGNEIIYNKKTIDKVNKYVTVENIKKENTNGKLNIVIPLSVKQLENKNFDVVISMRDGARINGLTVIQDGMTGHGPSVTATLAVDDASKVKSYEWKISTNNTCNSSVIGFTSTNKNSTFNNKLTSFGKYYVCAKMVDNTGDAQYRVSEQIDFSMQKGDIIYYEPATKNTVNTTHCSFNPSIHQDNKWLLLNNDGTLEIINIVGGNKEYGYACKFGYDAVIIINNELEPKEFYKQEYDSYDKELIEVTKKFENSVYSIGSRYPAEDENGTKLIKKNLGSYCIANMYGYFINNKFIKDGWHYISYVYDLNCKIVKFSFERDDDDDYTNYYQNNLAPIVILKSNLKYKSGNGTNNSPYVLVP